MIIPDFATPLILQLILLLCGYKSFKAIEDDESEIDNDKKWLTFWFCHAVFTTVKFILDIFYTAVTIPFYNEAMIGITLFLGFFGGAEVTYKVLKPFVTKYQGDIDSKLDEVANLARSKMQQVRAGGPAKSD